MASKVWDYSVRDASVLDFKSLTKNETVKLLGTPLLTAVSAAAGAASSVFVLRGMFGEDVIGRFEQLVGIIGGTVIGYKAGCIVFSFSGVVALGFVAAFIVGALAGGIICAMTAIRKQIFSAIQNLWTSIMDTICGFTKAVVEAVGNALAKVIDSMCRAYNTICTVLDKLSGEMTGMDSEQKEKIVKGVAAAAKKTEDSIDQAIEVFLKDVENILAGTSAEKAIDDVKKRTKQTKDENSKTLNEALRVLSIASTTTQ